MARISLTSFVDIISSAGTYKITAARKALTQDAYNPATDYYKAVRERIIEMHRQNLPKDYLLNISHHITDPKKIHNYLTIVDCYTKWVGNKKTTWIDPAQTEFGTDKIQIKVNPEIGLDINGNKHFIKLYFKSEPLSKHKADLIMELMKMSLMPLVFEPITMAVLDVRNKHLYVPTVQIPMLSAAVMAEISYLETFLGAL